MTIKSVKPFGILPLVFMSFIVVMMLGCPAFYDSSRRVTAQHHYGRAPSEETGQEIEKAKRLDRRGIIVFEFVMLAILGTSLFAFYRTRNKTSHYSS
jgi:hypothetical protein